MLTAPAGWQAAQMVLPADAVDRWLRLAQDLGGSILTADTCTPFGSVSYIAPAQQSVLAAAVPAPSVPSEWLAAAVEAVWRREPSGPPKLLIVATGPGSFTGLRVSLAFFKGLAMASGIPLIGVSSLAVLAAQNQRPETLVTLSARSDGYFSAHYRRNEAGELVPIWADGLRPHQTVVDYFVSMRPSCWLSDVTLHSDLPIEKIVPDLAASAWAIDVAFDRIRNQDFDEPKGVTAAYLQLSEPEKKLEANVSLNIFHEDTR